MNDPLAELRDIRLPDPVGWWPPAPGWWLLAVMVITALVLLVMWRRRARRRSAALRAALGALEQLQAETSSREPVHVVTAISTILRRFAISRFTRRHVAGLHGQSWRDFLERCADAHVDVGHLEQLAVAPYRPAQHYDVAELFNTARAWLRCAQKHGEPLP